MRSLKIILLIDLLFLLAAVSAGQQFPLLVRLLRYEGKTGETPVPSMKMGGHVQMSLKGKPEPGDQERACEIVAGAQRVVAHYADLNTALRDGYKPFFPSGKMGEMSTPRILASRGWSGGTSITTGRGRSSTSARRRGWRRLA